MIVHQGKVMADAIGHPRVRTAVWASTLILGLAQPAPADDGAGAGNVTIELRCQPLAQWRVAVQARGFVPMGHGIDNDGDVLVLAEGPAGWIATIVLTGPSLACAMLGGPEKWQPADAGKPS